MGEGTTLPREMWTFRARATLRLELPGNLQKSWWIRHNLLCSSLTLRVIGPQLRDHRVTRLMHRKGTGNRERGVSQRMFIFSDTDAPAQHYDWHVSSGRFPGWGCPGSPFLGRTPTSFTPPLEPPSVLGIRAHFEAASGSLNTDSGTAQSVSGKMKVKPENSPHMLNHVGSDWVPIRTAPGNTQPTPCHQEDITQL